jgi:hypothetical protein
MQSMGAPGRTSEPPESSSPSSRLTREQVVDRIITINPTAKTTFLASFNEASLGRYLDHLVATSGPRGRQSPVWMRPGDSPAIMTREPRD